MLGPFMEEEEVSRISLQSFNSSHASQLLSQAQAIWNQGYELESFEYLAFQNKARFYNISTMRSIANLSPTKRLEHYINMMNRIKALFPREFIIDNVTPMACSFPIPTGKSWNWNLTELSEPFHTPLLTGLHKQEILDDYNLMDHCAYNTVSWWSEEDDLNEVPNLQYPEKEAFMVIPNEEPTSELSPPVSPLFVSPHLSPHFSPSVSPPISPRQAAPILPSSTLHQPPSPLAATFTPQGPSSPLATLTPHIPLVPIEDISYQQEFSDDSDNFPLHYTRVPRSFALNVTEPQVFGISDSSEEEFKPTVDSAVLEEKRREVDNVFQYTQEHNETPVIGVAVKQSVEQYEEESIEEEPLLNEILPSAVPGISMSLRSSSFRRRLVHGDENMDVKTNCWRRCVEEGLEISVNSIIKASQSPMALQNSLRSLSESVLSVDVKSTNVWKKEEEELPGDMEVIVEDLGDVGEGKESCVC